MNKLILDVTKPIRYWIDKTTFKNKNHSSDLKSYQNKYQGKPLLIVGNGPSLNKTPLDKLRHLPSIGMNKIDLIYKKVLWRPDLVLVANNMVIKQHSEAIASNQIPTFVSWKARWFIPRKIRSEFHYFLTANNEDFSTDFSHGVGASGTVTYTALQLAYYLGADPVILVGVDHNFKFEGQPQSYQRMEGTDPNHFDPNYFQKDSYWGLPNLPASEEGYKKAKSLFEESGRKILDCTVGGKLQVFEKASIESFTE